MLRWELIFYDNIARGYQFHYRELLATDFLRQRHELIFRQWLGLFAFSYAKDTKFEVIPDLQ